MEVVVVVVGWVIETQIARAEHHSHGKTYGSSDNENPDSDE